nr:immunoglobulin heavy chain junction region [Mus musculus]MBK4196071.1 immunoglobulin heavy chain junction region [Mus musculus]
CAREDIYGYFDYW